jgi:hypothetical protein
MHAVRIERQCFVDQRLRVRPEDELIKKTAAILGDAVIAYTGETDVYHWWVFKGVVPTGTKVICTASGCRETTAWGEYQEAFKRGPGEPPAWASREK